MGNNGGTESGAVWNTPGKAVFLAHGGTAAYGISGSQTVGGYYAGTANEHAGVWGPNPVDLNPPGSIASAALATDGTYQGGSVVLGDQKDAAIWKGTAGSFVDLSNPNWSDTVVTGLSGGVQVGYGTRSTQQALLWRGSAASQVFLSPGFSYASAALGISRGQIVGFVTIQPTSSSGLVRHAALWTGQTPDSAVDVGFGPFNSQLNATNGTQQVGYAGISDRQPTPGVWWGSRASAQSLPLPAGYAYGEAFGIDQDGNIVGGAIPQGALCGGPRFFGFRTGFLVTQTLTAR